MIIHCTSKPSDKNGLYICKNSVSLSNTETNLSNSSDIQDPITNLVLLINKNFYQTHKTDKLLKYSNKGIRF